MAQNDSFSSLCTSVINGRGLRDSSGNCENSKRGETQGAYDFATVACPCGPALLETSPRLWIYVTLNRFSSLCGGGELYFCSLSSLGILLYIRCFPAGHYWDWDWMSQLKEEQADKYKKYRTGLLGLGMVPGNHDKQHVTWIAFLGPVCGLPLYVMSATHTRTTGPGGRLRVHCRLLCRADTHKRGLGIALEFALISENTSASFQQMKAAHQPAGHVLLKKKSACFMS